MNQDQSLSNRQTLSPYKQAITRYIRAALVLKGMKYDDLSVSLAQRGIIMTPENLRSKTHKGMFSADLFTMIIDVLGVENDALREILKQVHHD
ncbi:DUF6471 domain-containing protein [Teredinibacter haidensis]|uniref:DUF6471 domain-containing protein n=1 Tax=Teredinibacter haidensis TaxID=2731755 RepID=UPI000948A05E|nr:DUF6471 domain-containing protein [Teredinibacter haidensis]